ncbi:MAG: M48 family metalloprotease [Candidatus Omnitrophica bacterium]|nr:M48 family metalloprotease [Candidatus Omnitrophota bacterium]
MRKKILKYCLCGVLFVLVFGMTGCASLGTYNPATGRRELIIISTPAEVSMGQDIHHKVLREYDLVPLEDPLSRRVRKIGQRVAQVSDRQDYEYHFYVFKEDEMNAFTTPGGNIYIFSGLVEKLKTDGAIASVLAHEIGHCAARHTVKKFQAALGYNLIGSLIFSQVEMGEQARRIAQMSSDTAMRLVFSAYSRQDEYEADRLGVKYLDWSGYDVRDMIKALEILKAESKGPSAPLILRSHPYLTDRIRAIRKLIATK